MDPTEGSPQPSSGATEAPQDQVELGGAPATPPTPAGLAQTPAVELGQPAPVPTAAPEVDTLEKRLSDAQDKIRAQGEELAAYRASAAPRRMPEYQAPVLPVPPLGPTPGYDQYSYDPSQFQAAEAGYPPEQQLQLRPIQDILLQDAQARIHQLEVQNRLSVAEEAVGFRFNPHDREALMSFMEKQMPGSADTVAAAVYLFHDRMIKAAEERGRKSTLTQVQKGQQAAAPAPVGKTGEPQRDLSGLSFMDRVQALTMDEINKAKL